MTLSRHARPARRPLAAAVLAALAALPAVAGPPFDTGPVPGSPSEPVQAPRPPLPPEQAAPKLPENWQQLAANLTLADIVGIALANNEATRTTWFQARSAAAALGSEKAAYLPSVGLQATLSRVKQSAVGGQFSFQQTTYAPSVNLSWLLFDLGGRSGRIEEAEATLAAADWQHNAMIQSVILQVEQVYLSYLDAKAQLQAADATLKEAKENLDAAELRRKVGVATVADVLQARTSVAQAELDRTRIAGQITTIRGSLATAMGIPATTPIDVGTLPEELPTSQVQAEVQPLIDRALAERPDLAAQRWRAEKAAAHVGTVKAEGLPTVSVAAGANRTYYVPAGAQSFSNNWSASLVVSWPVFTGFAHTYDVRQAEADAEVARSTARTAEQQVILDVWTAHAALETAAAQVTSSRALLESAREAENVALGRYKEGVGSILDLLTAQANVSSARAQEITARTDWLVAVAQLAHATGGLTQSSSLSKESSNDVH